MLSKLRSRLRWPTGYEAVAIALAFLALGSGSYAAITVTGKNVKNSSLTGKDVKNNSLTGSDVKSIKSRDVSDRSLLAQDFKAGQLPAGAQGPKGDKGDKGDPGEAGSARGYAYVDAAGTFDPTKSKNVDRSVRFSQGIYCVNFTFGTPNVAVVTLVSAFGSATADARASCSVGGSTYNTTVTTTGASALADHDFYILAN